MSLKRTTGFTLVELNLAMVFVAILIMGIAITTLRVTKIYQQGNTYKEMNQISRGISDQLRRDILSGNAEQFAVIDTNGTGRLCLGDVSYIYNLASNLNNANSTKITVEGAGPIYFARVIDNGGSWCQPNSAGVYPMTVSRTQNFQDYLGGTRTQFAIHGLNARLLVKAVDSGGIVNVSYLIGTNEAGTTNATTCKPPTDASANFDYCVIRDFSITSRIGGGTGE